MRPLFNSESDPLDVTLYVLVCALLVSGAWLLLCALIDYVAGV